MIDESRTKSISTPSRPEAHPYTWSSLPIETLMRYKMEIEAHLPATKLKDVNVEAELVNQLRISQMLQARVIDLDGDGVPLNQVVQAVNSVAAIIEKLARLQVELAEAENIKKMEAAFIRAVEGLPAEAVEEFFKRYEHTATLAGVDK